MKKLLLCATATSCFVVLTCTAHARSAYDGSWNLAFVTQRGACDPAYNFTVNVSNGVVTHPNLLKFKGYVTKSGAVRASVTVHDKYASGLGRLLQRLRARDMERLRRKCAVFGLLDRATKLTSPQGRTPRSRNGGASVLRA